MAQSVTNTVPACLLRLRTRDTTLSLRFRLFLDH